MTDSGQRGDGASMSPYEDQLYRAYLLGAYGQQMGLDKLLTAVQSADSFDAACESREEKLDRELRVERQALRELRERELVWMEAA